MPFLLSSTLSITNIKSVPLPFWFAYFYSVFAKSFCIYLSGSLCFREFLYVIVLAWVPQKAEPETKIFLAIT